VQVRQLALNLAFFSVTKATQGLDSAGTAAAAHAVTVQVWMLGGVVLFALSTVATILVPAELAKGEKDSAEAKAGARIVANRMLAWGAIAGGLMGAAQIAALPLLKSFTPLEEVQRAARLPSIMGAVLQLISGLTFVAEGIMVGVQSFGRLAGGQVVATAALAILLNFGPGSRSLVGVWGCFYVFNLIRLSNALYDHFVSGPLARRANPPSAA
jgi:Na+-driven multidrug efflux pump